MRFAILTFLAGSGLLAQTPQDLLDRGHFKRARAFAETKLRSEPQDAQANYLMARVKQAFGDIDGAVLHAGKAVAGDPKNAENHALLGQLYGRQAQRKSVFGRLGLARKCKRETEMALALDPDHFEAHVTLMVYLVQAPAIAGGDRKRGLAIPGEISKREPWLGYLAQTQLAEEERQNVNFEELYRKAVEANPTSYKAQSLYTGYLIKQPQPKLALIEVHAQQMRKLDPQRTAAYALLASVYATGDRFTDLDRILKESEANIPDNLSPFFSAARVLTKQAIELDRAETYLRKYLTQEPEANAAPRVHAHWLLGLALEKLGRKPEAITELQKAVAFEPARKDLKRLKG